MNTFTQLQHSKVKINSILQGVVPSIAVVVAKIPYNAQSGLQPEVLQVVWTMII